MLRRANVLLNFIVYVIYCCVDVLVLHDDMFYNCLVYADQVSIMNIVFDLFFK